MSLGESVSDWESGRVEMQSWNWQSGAKWELVQEKVIEFRDVCVNFSTKHITGGDSHRSAPHKKLME